ncbi:hypothetical protein DACRYDRAFT_104512 [Dacryopinax primogenitus]|uniref:Uncharacterized protein n=1 Tax=Dacryopinax primogenitus (strain DJM 731) TaxID=1858805 RepID=M5G8W9_DACPD|nr:uncharacterized protein DACRYDRAFT_104512 [Dacryopinax primogenitus]EJU04630.1 hypothetical protein DACRYDRAFT_104512 [Dacryopinax primogenitus]
MPLKIAIMGVLSYLKKYMVNVIVIDSNDEPPARKTFGDEDYDCNHASPSLGEEEDEEVILKEIAVDLRQHAASMSTTGIDSRDLKGRGRGR